ncbi:MAG: aldehyde dehydrogenase family protein [Planctomycetaceae bacterium]
MPSQTITVSIDERAGVVSGGVSAADLKVVLAESRSVQRKWSELSVRQRLRVLRRLRLLAADRAVELAASVGRESLAETLSAEVLPLLDALRYLERCAVRLLRERRVRLAGRPLWLWGNRVIRRPEPLGLVLVIGPGNYPLYLPGVQFVQALAAGNGVLLKPAPGCGAPLRLLVQLAIVAGLPEGLVQILDDSAEAGAAAMCAGVDKVVLTGSAATGRAVSGQLAAGPVPAVMELSGCDAVFVLEDADQALVADCLWFGLRLNGGRTCLAPRRVFVRTEQADSLIERLRARISAAGGLGLSESSGGAGEDASVRHALRVIGEAVQQGAVVRSGSLPDVNGRTSAEIPIVLDLVRPEMLVAREDLFFPVLSVVRVRDVEEALEQSRTCAYALAATVFGGTANAMKVARKVDAGTVVLNDMIAVTADPRVSFEGRHASGFGATRGEAGLFEFVQVKQVIQPRPFFRPHLEDIGPCDAVLLKHLIGMEHAGWFGRRLLRLPGLMRAALQQWNWRRQQN